MKKDLKVIETLYRVSDLTRMSVLRPRCDSDSQDVPLGQMNSISGVFGPACGRCSASCAQLTRRPEPHLSHWLTCRIIPIT
jgi:hypothetical protein